MEKQMPQWNLRAFLGGLVGSFWSEGFALKLLERRVTKSGWFTRTKIAL